MRLKLVKGLLFVLVAVLGFGLGQLTYKWVSGEYTSVSACSEFVTTVDLKEVDKPLASHYIDEACELTESTDLVLSGEPITMVFAPFDVVLQVCEPAAPPGSIALACTYGRGGEDNPHFVVVPHGHPGLARHEMLHVIMDLHKLPGELHHPLMQVTGTEWIGGDR
jgi:hypothetical protein